MALLSDKQQEYRRNATRRWNVKTGATRSGKTYGDYMLLPKRILAGHNLPGLNVIIGNTRGTLQRNIITPLQDLYGGNLVSDIHSDNTAELFGESCYCLGADNVRHVNRLRGSGIKYCYGDEVTTWHLDVFTMLKSRLDKPYSRFDGTCNPDNPHHWFKAFLDSDVDLYQQAYTIDDNPFLDSAFVENLKREYTGTVYYDRYINGLWVAAEGSIYRTFADNPEKFIITAEWLKAHPLSTATIGVDFGGNRSGHAFTCTGFTHGLRGMATLAEWYHKGEITPEKLETAFVDFAQGCIDTYGAKIAYCDSAETTLIQGLRSACIRAKLPLRVEKAKKGPIADRIRFLCRMMAAGRYHIINSCNHTRDALSSTVWDSKKLEDVRLDDGTTNIDSLDALEYSFEPYMEAMTYAQGGHKTRE